eukprot:Gb_06835 [translate_table: standard]
MSPFFLYNINNTGFALLAIEAGLMGSNYSISTACASANHSLYSAANHIRKGEVDIMLVGGTKSPIKPVSLGGFIACRALSQRNDDPQTASRPWDTQHVMDEGYGVLFMIGHYFGVVGGLEAIATIKAITTGWLHPTINQFLSCLSIYVNIKLDVTIDTVPNVKKQHEVHVDKC